MSLTAEQIARRQAAREDKLPEFRKVEALEAIADALGDIQAQLISIGHSQGNVVRQLGTIVAKIR